MNWPIFDLCITAINLLLSGVNLWILYQLRAYNPKRLEKYRKQWRSNVNYESARKLYDEAKSAQKDQR